MLTQIFRPETLHLRWPFGKTFLWALLVLALLAGSVELGARAQVATGILDGILPPASVGGVSPELDVKVEYLDRLVAKNGRVECIFLGSSQVDGGIDPVVLKQVYQEQAGRPLTCFNFGLVSLTGEAAGPIAQMLAARYQPDLLVIGLSARDFSADFGELSRPLVSIPWVQRYQGSPSRRAWLVDHSAAYRYYLGLQNWLDPENRENIARYEHEVTSLGYVPLPQQVKDLVQLEELLLKNFTLHSPDLEGLRMALDVNSEQTRVILLEMPVHPQFYNYYVEGGPEVYQSAFFHPVAQIAAENGVPFWATQAEVAVQIPGDGWNDRRHFNEAGARVFTSWVAQRFVEEGLP